MNATGLHIKNLTTGYGKSVITSGINADLKAGELTCLLGPNGTGKSTLLRTLCGFQSPISGQIYIEGKEISTLRPSTIAKLEAIVLTERLQAMNMTVRDLVEMGRSPYTGFWGGLSKEDKAIVEDAMELSGISPLESRFIHTLSDGERQKAMISRALAQSTPIILLDEPTAFLDYPSKVETLMLLRRIAREQQKAVLLSTHDLDVALQIADSVWLLSPDKSINVGTPKELAKSGALLNCFSSLRQPFLDALIASALKE